jgi:Carboxypeptidase regulatory-like domain
VTATTHSPATDPTERPGGPAVTYAWNGRISEADPGHAFIAGAVVEILTGAMAGTTATTDALGGFAIPGLPPGPMDVHVSKGGYQPGGASGLTMDRNLIFDLMLYPTPPNNDAGVTATARCNDGTWTWTATRRDACAANGGIAYGVSRGPLGEVRPPVR